MSRVMSKTVLQDILDSCYPDHVSAAQSILSLENPIMTFVANSGVGIVGVFVTLTVS